MAPLFLASYTAETGNTSLLHESFEKCRQLPRAAAGIRWAVIAHPRPTVCRHEVMVTRNAWAATRMTRVLATVARCSRCQAHYGHAAAAAAGLTGWICEIVDGTIDAGAGASKGGLVKNYLSSFTGSIVASALCVRAFAADITRAMRGRSHTGGGSETE